MRQNQMFMQQNKPFNMDSLFVERINERLNNMDEATIEGDQLKRYRVLRTIFIDTHFKYVDEEPGLKNKFLEIKQVLTPGTNYQDKGAMVQYMSLKISEAELKIDELHLTITKLLYENDLIHLKKRKIIDPYEEIMSDYE